MHKDDGLTLRERIAARGVESLSDSELLAVVMGEDTATAATTDAERLLEEYGGQLSAVCSDEIARLRMTAGLGLRRAERIAAAAELGRRVSAQQSEQVQTVESSDDIRRMFAPRMEGLQHEECWAIYLTASNRVVDSRRVSQGGVSGTVVDHRLVVKRALELLVPQIIVVHNHPSGSAQPSGEDDRVTERLREAAALFDIRLLDHIIIARGSHFSYAAQGRL
ncbi:MAG: DNA repair protein RadC [Rikenellaceae bacterium]|nr:DNA repair protein RadC [Rikenellaceae bacterium]MBR3800252.1 DNA repair protein RadC [Rikenellaceae bacterium]